MSAVLESSSRDLCAHVVCVSVLQRSQRDIGDYSGGGRGDDDDYSGSGVQPHGTFPSMIRLYMTTSISYSYCLVLHVPVIKQ